MGAQVSTTKTGSHENGNIATGGSTINYTNINYYRDSYAAAATRQDFTQDPNKFTSPVLDALREVAPPLKSPSAEACGYSDRVAQLTVGNSTITTQEAANIVVGYGEWPEYCPDVDATAVDKPTRPDVSVNRFYTLSAKMWQKESKGWYWKFPDILTEKGVFGQNAQFHYLYRSGFCVHVQCNASKFHQGALLVALMPEHVVAGMGAGDKPSTAPHPDYKTTQPGPDGAELQYPYVLDCGVPISQLLICPHQWINLRTNNCATIIMPYINSVPYDSAINHCNFTLFVIPVSPLNYDAGATAAIPITVTVAPLCAEFGGLRQAVSQGLPVEIKPGSYQFLTTDDEVSAPILPGFQPTPEIHIPGEVRNLLELCQVETILEVNNTTDTHGMSRLLIPVSAQTAADKLCASFRVDPGRSGPWESTLLGQICRYYTQWSGSLEVTFMFTGSFMATGKMLIAYTPPGGEQPKTRDVAMLGTHVIWDFGLQSSVTLVIPWISNSHYRTVETGGILDYYSTGIVTIWYQTNFVVPTGAPTSAYIIALGAAQKNFTLKLCRDTESVSQTAILQGDPIADIIEGAVTQTTNRAISGSIQPVTAANTQPSSHRLGTGQVPALQAAETGATSNATDESMIETRCVVNRHGVMETSVEHFFSRSGLAGILIIEDSGTSTKGYATWEIDVMGFVQLRRKLEMFTYMRFDAEFTFITAERNGNTSPIPVQYMYVPPGAPVPTGRDTFQWQTATNPSVISKMTDPPAQVSVPFMSPASTYQWFYDGYPTFGEPPVTTNLNYGQCPNNKMGTFCIRMVSGVSTGKDVTVRIFMKLKHVRAWVPRPIRSQPYLLKNYPNFDKANIVDASSNRTSITTTGKFGQQSGAIYVGNYRVVNRHLATHNDWTNLVWEDSSRDLLVSSTTAQGCDTIARCNCQTGVYYCNSKRKHYPVSFSKPSLIFVEASEYYPARYQSHLMLAEGYSEPGDCGGILRCQHGVVGIVSTGGNGLVGFASVRDLLWLDEEAMEQGVSDYIKGLGDAFGTGFTDAVSREVEALKNHLIGSEGAVEKILKNLVKLISALVIVIRSDYDMVTLTATLALIGCHGSPWAWIKSKTASILGIPMAQKQSASWLKKFNDMANAAKGLEWISNKISKFIDWLKEKIIPAAKEKVEFLSNLKQLPLLENQISNLEQSAASQEDLEAMFGNVSYLAHFCRKFQPLYATEAKRVYALEKRMNNYMQFKSKHRIEPVCLIIRGSPGTGKSLATGIIARAIADKYHSSVYSLPPDPDHFDGYKQQVVTVMDDLCQNPDGKDMSLFCQMVSTVDFIPPMASLEEKGVSFTSKFVIASTNASNIIVPTVSDSDAIRRRFFMDCDIEVTDSYKTDLGRLDAGRAAKLCSENNTANFKRCSPLVCGKAIQLRDRKSKVRYSVDTVVSELIREYNSRSAIGNTIEALFQGPPKFRPIRISLEEKPAPDAISDLLASVDSEEIRQYCRERGWIIPETPTNVERHLNRAVLVMQSIATVVAVVSLVYVIYKLFAGFQGAYSGAPKQALKKPVLRTATVQGPSLDFALSLLKRNIRQVQTDQGHFTMLGVRDRLAILPRHSQPGKTIWVEHKLVNVLDAVELVDEQGVNLELTLVTLDTNEKFRDVTKFIPENISGANDATLVINTEHMPSMFVPVGDVVQYGFLNLSGKPTHRTMMYNFPTKAGQCGGVVTSVGKIIGIHIGGNGRQGFCAGLKRSYFASEQGEIQWVKPNKETGRLNINGPTRTKLEPSVFHDVFEGNKEPAVLTNKDPRLEVDFEQALFSKYVGNALHEPDEYVQQAALHYANQLKQLDINTNKMSMEEACYGTENLEAIDLHTSAGYPYSALGIKKRDILDPTTRDVSKMKFYMDKYGLDLPYSTYVKDELRSLDKIKKGKSRLIEASSLNDSVYLRMTFGHLYEVFHANPGTVTGSAVGCNPDVFWSKLPILLPGSLFAFDYSGYDASLSPVWFRALEMVLRDIGYSEEAVSLIEGINHTHHVYRNKTYCVLGGMPSGCSGTSIFNSMINNIIIRTLLIKTFKGIDLDELNMVAYGDDVLASYPFPIDCLELAKTGKEYGLTMTPADKSSCFNEVTWENATFLKRGFLPDHQFPFLIHPTMPMKEIHESIRWTKDARNTQDHVRSLCLLAWHNGKDEYENFVSTIRSVPVGKALAIPNFENLRRNWLELF
uniref:Genome polyprotein n=19 Tax=Enterovirus TaxID=12059 RepID=A0A2D1VM76_9ENTO|nr:polyprotein [Coxsackievirus A5]ATP75729.1 polyprotein [Coxsackievirus A5]ATP75730.1 polyprotein [Coxsackievirus A5]